MGRKKRKQEVYVSLRLYPGQDDELIRWLERFDDQPYGTKSQAVKDALVRGIGTGTGVAAAAPALDLGEVRRVVEAAMATALARFEGQLVGVTVSAPAEDSETEDLLDALGEALVLGDDKQ